MFSDCFASVPKCSFLGVETECGDELLPVVSLARARGTGHKRVPLNTRQHFCAVSPAGALAQDAQGGAGGSSLEIFKKTSRHGLVQAALGVSVCSGVGPDDLEVPSNPSHSDSMIL